MEHLVPTILAGPSCWSGFLSPKFRLTIKQRRSSIVVEKHFRQKAAELLSVKNFEWHLTHTFCMSTPRLEVLEPLDFLQYSLVK